MPENIPGKSLLRSWLNKNMVVHLSDGRYLNGIFLCTDQDANLILGSCAEYMSETGYEPRTLGLAMVPGKHIVSLHVDDSNPTNNSPVNDEDSSLHH